MAPTIFKTNLSAPSCAVMMTCKALELEDVEFKDIDLKNGEHMEEEFLEMNPQHTVPVLKDEDYVLHDSNAITAYLVGKYGSDDSLYPNDLNQRGLVNQRLFFNCGVLHALLRRIVRMFLVEGETHIPENVVDSAIEAYGFLDSFLKDNEWFAGESVTIADINLLPSISWLNVLIPIDEDCYPKVIEWLNRVKELPFYEINEENLNHFKNLYETLVTGLIA